jgi:serine/threonine protein kinase
VSTGPLQPIPEATQPYVDRLLGSLVGEFRVQERVCEGRYGTIYRARHPTSGQEVTLEVLRTALTGHDEEVRAVAAIKSPGIATVSGFGELPDGRRYRGMEVLAGESLDQLVQRKGRLPPDETARLLAQVAGVLEAAHAWALAHGCLGPSSVFVAGDSMKLIDYGLAKKPATAADDLKALGAMGFSLLTGEDFTDRAPPPLSDAIPELLDRVLRELMEARLENATVARKELEGLLDDLQAAPPVATQPLAPSAPKRSRAPVLVVLVAVLAAAAGVAFFTWPRAAEPQVPVASADDDEAAFVDEPADEATDELTDEPADEQTVPPVESTEPGVPRPPHKSHRPARPVPSAQALNDQIWRLEDRLRKQARPGDDVEQAMFVLNKQRLRLTGNPSVQDRRDVARQLAGWRRSYLRP